MEAETGDTTLLGKGEKLKINNLSRVSWNYEIDGSTDYVVVTGYEQHPETLKYISKAFALKTDGSDAVKSILELSSSQVLLNNVTGNIHSVDVNTNNNFVVLDAGYINLTAYNENTGKSLPLLDYLTRFQNNGEEHPRYRVGQARWSPCGRHITFVRWPGPNSILGEWESMNKSDIFVLFDIDKMLDETDSPIYAPIPPDGKPSGLGWDDPRLLKLTDDDGKFHWNPNWSRSGDIVNWSTDDSGSFDLLNYYDKNYETDNVYTEFSNAHFNIYFRKIDLINKTTGSEILKYYDFEGSVYSMNYNFDGEGKTTMIKMDVDEISILTMNISEKANIGVNGGILFDHGKTTIVVPANEIRSVNTELSLSEPAHIPDGEADGVRIVTTGAARNFYPEGITFDNYVELTLYYTVDDLTSLGIVNNMPKEHTLKIYWYNHDASEWVEYGGIVDVTDGPDYAGKITIFTNHFSLYGVGMPYPVSDTLSTFTVEKDTLYIEDSETVSFFVQLINEIDSPIKNRRVDIFSIPDDGIIINYNSGKTDSNGIVDGYISFTKTGEYILSLINEIGDTIISETKQISVRNKTELIFDELSYIELNNHKSLADGINSVSGKIILNDKFDSGIKDISVSLIAADINNFFDSEVFSGITDINGEMYFEFVSEKICTKIIIISYDLISDTKIIYFVEQSNIKFDKNEIILEDNDTISFVITMIDTYGQPVSNYEVSIITEPQSGLLIHYYRTETSDTGLIYGYITAENSGIYSIKIIDDNNSVMFHAYENISVISKYDWIDSNKSYIETIKDSAYADGNETISLKIYIMDENDEIIPDLDILLILQNKFNSKEMIKIPETTNSQGFIHFYYSFSIAKQFILIITDNNENIILNDTAIINFHALPEPKIKILKPDDNLDTIYNNITVTGITNNTFENDLIEIYLNGELLNYIMIESADSEWSFDINLIGVEDIITVKLKDKWNRYFYDTVTINYLKPPPVAQIDYEDTKVFVLGEKTVFTAENSYIYEGTIDTYTWMLDSQPDKIYYGETFVYYNDLIGKDTITLIIYDNESISSETYIVFNIRKPNIELIPNINIVKPLADDDTADVLINYEEANINDKIVLSVVIKNNEPCSIYDLSLKIILPKYSVYYEDDDTINPDENIIEEEQNILIYEVSSITPLNEYLLFIETFIDSENVSPAAPLLRYNSKLYFNSIDLASAEELSVLILFDTPVSPANFYYEDFNEGHIKLTWDNVVNNDIILYNIYWDSGAGIIDFLQPLATVYYDANYYEIDFLVDTSYKFVVRSQNKYGIEEINHNILDVRSYFEPPAEVDPDSPVIFDIRITNPVLNDSISGNNFIFSAELFDTDVNIPDSYSFSVEITSFDNLQWEIVALPKILPWQLYVDLTEYMNDNYFIRFKVHYDEKNPEKFYISDTVSFIINHINWQKKLNLLIDDDGFRRVQISEKISNETSAMKFFTFDNNYEINLKIPQNLVEDKYYTENLYLQITQNRIINNSDTVLSNALNSLNIHPVSPPFKIILTDGEIEHNIFKQDKYLELEISYIEDDNYLGFIKDSNIQINDVEMLHYSTNTKLWNKCDLILIDSDRKFIKGKAEHLSYFILAGISTVSNVDNILVYPNPFIPNDGLEKTGLYSKGIIFDEIPDYSIIKIFTINGTLVKEERIENSLLNKYIWNIKNNRGDLVSSGVYLYLINSPVGNRTGKFVIIR